MRTALQESLGDGLARCDTCAYQCELSPGQVGICRIRRNVAGEIVYEAFGTATVKCPLIGSCGADSFCVAAPSCNWSCSFCSSASNTQPELARAERTGELTQTEDGFVDRKAIRGRGLTMFPLMEKFPRMDPGDVVEEWRASGKSFFAMRTSEPSIHYETVKPILEGVRNLGGKTFINTNGYWTPRLVDELGPLLDGVEVGVKASGNERFLRKVAGVPKFMPVLETIRGLVSHGCTVHVSDIPVYHGGWERDFERLAEFVAEVVPHNPDFPRMSLYRWLDATRALGNYRAGIPRHAPGGSFAIEDRSGLLARAAQIAVQHLGSCWVSLAFGHLSQTPKGDAFEAQEFIRQLGKAEVVREGGVFRVARDREALGQVVEVTPAPIDKEAFLGLAEDVYRMNPHMAELGKLDGRV